MVVRQRPDWVDDELFPFDSRFVDIGGHTVHYIDEGSGPTLLFLHGNPTWSFVYREVIKELRDDFRCVAVDYPGFGLSVAAPGYGYLPADHAQVITDFIDELALSAVTLVVHDWGGPIGLAALARRPAAVERLVLGNTWAWPTDAVHVQIMSRVMGGPLGRLLIRQFNLFVNAMIPAGHRLRKPSGDEMAHYQQALASPLRREASGIFPRELTASREFLAEVASTLPAIASLPVLIIWGTGDIAFGDRELTRWKDTFSDHRVELVAGAGHFVQSDAPHAFAAAIRDWR
ncbi:alpha/beta hydrolase [Mycobacterium adipatum]|uniref:Alpha/beta hydrolase n=1 Tax=Mycobacterium adipatum TaxID=1682113 RepID=A0A172UVN3_9MYCO|nr:alpha/beta fold hydrolase [Mycobacterium adipatum]ANE83030.1 alpha/beta hydrolase [Mycobacterium adipatum]MBI5737000.1 alpha/beta fold hydrolase [Mycolicibacterium neoaurum]